ncbi:MAG TPA: FtsX-like permease family protein [Anaerolineales bacterium]|nr:FtsX-like permease family protein [Anaerolineales bacterium]
MNLQLTLAARYLAGRKLRTALTTLAIIFGVMLIFGMNTVMPTMIAALQANVQGAEGESDFTITNVAGDSFPADATSRLQDIDGVRAVAASLERTINLPADFVDHDPARPDKIIAVNLVGILPEQARSIRAYPIIDGRYLNDSDTAATVISQTLAAAFSVKVGDSIRLPSTSGLTELTVIGILPASIGPENESVLVTLPQAQKMTGETGKVNTIRLNIEAFADQARRAQIQKEIEAVMGKNYRVGTLIAGEEMFGTMKQAQIGLSVFGALALFMGGFIIFNTFRTVVTERRRDIGMLRALGATRRTVIGFILTEGFLQGLLGSAIGLLAGYLMAFGVLKVAQGPLSTFINIKLGLPVVEPGLVIISILLGVGVTLLAGLLPAWSASRVTPLEALRPTVAELEFKRQTGVGFWIGIVIIVLTVLAILSGQSMLILPGGILFLVGLVLVAPGLIRPFANLFGRVVALATVHQGIGGLAQSNLTRQPSRVAVTASTSLLGLAVIVAAGGLVTSMSGTLSDMMHDSLGSDYVFLPPSVGFWGSNVGAAPELAESLRAVPGVDTVSTLRFAGSQAGGQVVSVLGIQPDEFQRVSGLVFIEGNKSAYKKIASEHALIANSVFMMGAGLNLGDTVELSTPDGRVPYRIVAVASDLLNAKINTVYISQSNLQSDFGSTEDVFLQIDLREGADREAAGAQIRALGENYPQFKVISGADYYNTAVAQLKTAFSAIYILFAILAFPSLIAMLNTLTINVIERTREIGMIRAVGGTRKQIRNLIMAEALLLAAIGATFGILGGMYLGYVLVTAITVIFPMGYSFPVSGIAAAIVIGLLFGALAAVIPARQAARLGIVQALRYE